MGWAAVPGRARGPDLKPIARSPNLGFPSDFSDLGYIEFEKNQLVAELGNLFKELVALDILEVRAKG